MTPPRPTDPRLVALGRAVEHVRTERRLTTTALGARARLTPSYLHGIENAEIHPTYLVVCRLADALVVAPHELVALAFELPEEGPAS
jgi:transcriptional regulator with XRE-family HTH domain